MAKKKSQFDVYKTTTREGFIDLLKKIFQLMFEFKRGFKLESKKLIDQSSRELTELLDNLYTANQLNLYNTEFSSIVDRIIKQYNEFTLNYNKFINIPDRKGEEAQKYGHLADQKFDILMLYLNSKISELESED